MKLQLDEQTLNAYINQAINEEINEFLGLSRADKNAKWGYTWDPSLSTKQNRRNRDLQRAQIRAAGYNNYDEYAAGKGLDEAQEPKAEPQQQQAQIPTEYPYKNDRTVTGKYKIGQFQTWFNQNMGGKLAVDGIWGPKTESAYQQWLATQNRQ